MSTLVVVSCGKCKIWDIDPHAGPTAAKNVYQGSPFKVNREYAETCGDRWVILSAKYGLIDPDFEIPSNYDVTFSDPLTKPISVADLVRQVREMGPHRFDKVIVLGGAHYSERVSKAFAGTDCEIVSPRAGLRTGNANAKVKEMTARCRQKGTAS